MTPQKAFDQVRLVKLVRKKGTMSGKQKERRQMRIKVKEDDEN